MTLDQVIEKLKEMRDEIGGDAILLGQDPQLGTLDLASFNPQYCIEVEEFGVRGSYLQYMTTEYSSEATHFILVKH